VHACQTLGNARNVAVSVDFLRRSLKNRPTERAGQSRPSGTGTTSSSSTGKCKEGADRHESDEEIDVYDAACREIRMALDAYAVAVVDLSQFHLSCLPELLHRRNVHPCRVNMQSHKLVGQWHAQLSTQGRGSETEHRQHAHR
jgi:hypothetical protein